MIFKIADGRECFYQWDIDRQIIVSDPTITEVHFCNRTDVCSLVVGVVDGIANVPNKVLQSGFDVRVFGYDGKATIHEATFEVKARTQPTDYVYTETEIKQFSDLEARIDEIERNGISEEVITEAVVNYLEENPITMDGYATEDYVNEAVSNVKPDLTGLATESYVDEAVSNAKPDLSGYAKKSDIPDTSKFITSIPSEYVTESELNSMGYAKASALNDKANVNHSHSEYAKTKHTHDMADVNGLQIALSDKASQADIDKAIELHNHDSKYAPISHSHGDEYATKTHTHNYENLLNKPTIPSVEGLASEAYVNTAIANIKIPSVEGLATEKYVDDAIANIEIAGGGDVDLSNYYTKAETEALIPSVEGLATEEYVNNAVSNIEIPEGTEVIELNVSHNSGTASLTTEVAKKVAANPSKYVLKVTYNSKNIKGVYYTFSRFEDASAYGYSNIYYAAITETGLATNPEIKLSTLSIFIQYQSDNTTVESGSVSITVIDNVSGPSEPTDLTNYYTKEETNQAIQTALSAIGVAEGGAY